MPIDACTYFEDFILNFNGFVLFFFFGVKRLEFFHREDEDMTVEISQNSKQFIEVKLHLTALAHVAALSTNHSHTCLKTTHLHLTKLHVHLASLLL